MPEWIWIFAPILLALGAIMCLGSQCVILILLEKHSGKRDQREWIKMCLSLPIIWLFFYKKKAKEPFDASTVKCPYCGQNLISPIKCHCCGMQISKEYLASEKSNEKNQRLLNWINICHWILVVGFFVFLGGIVTTILT